MSVRALTGWLLVGALLAAPAGGALVVTLDPRAADMTPIDGPVSVGSEIVVDVLLSVDGTDNPLRDIRSIQLDFRASSPELVRGPLVWMLDPGVSDASYLVFNDPIPSVTYLGTSRVDGFILDLNGTPVRVAEMAVTVNGSGILTVQSASTVNPSSGTVVSAGFTAPSLFSSNDGNIGDGTLALAVDIPSPPPNTDGSGAMDPTGAPPLDPGESVDTDGDGVPDVNDAFPLDPDRSAVEDGSGTVPGGGGDNGSGGNSNGSSSGAAGGGSGVGPAGGLCGVSMVSTLAFLMFGLTALRPSARRFRRG